MSARKRDTNIFDQGASRRQFFKLLATSPLLGLAAAGLPTSWQHLRARRSDGPRRPRRQVFDVVGAASRCH